MSQFAAYPSLRDVPVFITGGGSGIGAAMVEGFVLQGSRVAFVDVDRTASLALCSRLEKAGPHAAHFIPCDVRDIDALRTAIDSAQKAVGDIGVLVNNAARDDRHRVVGVVGAEPREVHPEVTASQLRQFDGVLVHEPRLGPAVDELAGRRDHVTRVARDQPVVVRAVHRVVVVVAVERDDGRSAGKGVERRADTVDDAEIGVRHDERDVRCERVHEGDRVAIGRER